MPHFMLAYHGGGKRPESAEAGAAAKARWDDWIKDMGDAMINPGTPLGASKVVSAEGVTNNEYPNPLIGYSVIEAKDLDHALEIAQTCPYLEMGTIGVAEMMQM